MAKRIAAAVHPCHVEAILMATDGGGALAGRLGRIAGGDATAFTELVEAYDADMARLCLVICGDVELARDATQNAWHRLWTQPPTLRDDGKLRSWLLSVAANEARQMLRRRRRGAALEERALVDGSATRSAGPEERSEEWMDLATALAALRPNERELVALRYVLELSSAQIAEHLGISAEGVRSRLHRLLARLRKELDR